MPGFAALETIPADLWWNRSCDCSDPTGQHSTASLDRTVADDVSTLGISEHTTAGPITDSLEDLSASAYPLSPNSHPGFDTLDRALAGNVSTTGKCVPFATGKFFEMFAGSFGTMFGLPSLWSATWQTTCQRRVSTGFYRPLPFDGKFVNNKRLRGGGLLQRLGVLQSLVRPPAAPRSPAAPWQCGLLQRLAGAPSHDGAPGGRQALGGRAFWALR